PAPPPLFFIETATAVIFTIYLLVRVRRLAVTGLLVPLALPDLKVFKVTLVLLDLQGVKV
ncbi:hypothetical protein, partial [Bacillus cereus group sp. N15]|uniref:hypothetical protein n=1 Tax=Bacillus cereus group sp. N15 TaxID=2794588 RepID=UPI001A7E7F06